VKLTLLSPDRRFKSSATIWPIGFPCHG
jgi:hypothetical protein